VDGVYCSGLGAVDSPLDQARAHAGRDGLEKTRGLGIGDWRAWGVSYRGQSSYQTLSLRTHLLLASRRRCGREVLEEGMKLVDELDGDAKDWSSEEIDDDEVKDVVV
jgi:hypothetical protein